METIEIMTNGGSNLVKIKGTLMAGKIHAIMNALEKSDSVVAHDVLFFFRNAIYRDNLKNPQSTFQSTTETVD